MMSDGMLSQDEIDALLRGTDDIEDENEAFDMQDSLSLMEKDALGEIGNISFGSSATALSTLLNQKVEITTPTVTVILRSKIAEEFPHPYVAIQVKYTEGFSGINLLVIKKSDAAIIADLMLGGDGINPSELMGEIQLSAVQEAFNQMMGSAATSMSTIFSKRVDISPPSIDILNIAQGEGTDKIPDDDMLVKISFRLKIGDLIDSTIMQMLPIDFAKSLVNELMNPISSDLETSSTVIPSDHSQVSGQTEPVMFQNEQPVLPNIDINAQQDYAQVYPQRQPYPQGNPDVQGQQPYPQGQPYPGYYQMPMQGEPHRNNSPQHLGSEFPTDGGFKPSVQPAVFSNFEPYPLQETEARNLEMLLDIPLQVTVELGRTKRSVKEILALSQGSIIELDKLAGEPVDIFVNNRLIAKGEVVVIDENFGVRVTDIISKSDRINKLK